MEFASLLFGACLTVSIWAAQALGYAPSKWIARLGFLGGIAGIFLGLSLMAYAALATSQDRLSAGVLKVHRPLWVRVLGFYPPEPKLASNYMRPIEIDSTNSIMGVTTPSGDIGFFFAQMSLKLDWDNKN